MRTPTNLPRRFNTPSRRARIWLLLAAVLLIVLIASLRGIAHFWTDYLWFQSVGFTSVFRGVLVTKVLLSVVFIVIFFTLMLVNLYIADRVAPVDIDPADANDLVLRYRDTVFPHGRLVTLVVSAVFALLAGTGADREWNNWDLFIHHVSFGVKDPEFHKDVGFYVFQLPFIEFLLGWAFEAMIVVLIVTTVAHYLNGGILPQSSSSNRTTLAVKAHLSVLLGVLAVIKSVDYYYERLELVLSRNHVVNGATATSIHAQKPALFLLMIIGIIAAVLFLANVRQRGWMLPSVAVALWVLVSIVVGGIYPAAYQALVVSPSELTKESTYIQRNINATRAAYGLDKVQVQSEATNYNYTPTVTASEITGDTPQELDNQQTLANVPLLEPSVTGLINTVDKYQALRSYYSFNDLDLDRYPIDGQETATVASVRELNSNVPSGFVNTHLEYTHGYGAVVAPISQAGVNTDGTPNFTLSGLPPTGAPSLSESGSQIYYGEGADTGGYVIADSKTTELDYESTTGQEITNKYTGKGGVEAGSLLRRAAFALRFGDPNFILSGQINPSSRVMYIRNINQRVAKAAPFLKFDADPYAVILNGSVYWVIDAYTTTDNYPYSQNANVQGVPSNSGLDSKFNYARNSVKVVVSAYDGSMHFFDMGTGDPILKAYEKAFPDLFTPVSEADTLIPGIVAHFRYPEDIFQVQANMYGRYHLTDAADFYSQAQAWTISPDPGSGELSENSTVAPTTSLTGQAVPVARIPPQYILAHLPGSTQQDTFILVTPFVPISSSTVSQNLTAFMTASSDPSDYGVLRVYETPPGSTVDGPGLISNAIRSNPAISQELTLYDQKGSQVELGEVAIVPIDQTLMYVQPVYVESSSNLIPTLRDVVVVYNGTAFHSSNASLDGALCQITNPGVDGAPPTQPFKQYCGTPAATSTLPAATTPAGTGTNSSTTTTTTPASTTTTTVPAGTKSTVQSLLAQAQTAYAAAQAAQTAGNNTLYQTDFDQFISDLSQAEQMAAKQPTGPSG